MYYFFRGIFISKNKICPVCGSIVTNPNKTYCDSCISRFNTHERKALVGINKGQYKKTLARKMLKLRKKGKSNAAIAREVKLPNPSINSGLVVPIIKFLLMDEANDVLESFKNHVSNVPNKRIKTCLVCGSEFIQEKGKTQKYCRECNIKYDTYQKRVIIGINEGKYNKDLAIKIKAMLDEGVPKTVIGKKYNVVPSLINTIIEYLYYDEFNPNSLKWPRNNSFIDKNDLKSLNLDSYLIKTESENEYNILIKGSISKENSYGLFKCLSGNGISVNDMSFSKKKENVFEVSIDLDVDKIYEDSLIFELKILGFE